MTEATATIADLEALERRLSRPDIERDVLRLKGWRKNLEADESFGRVFSGPQWLGGASIVDGTVEGNVFKAQVTISNLFQTAESPADRWELDSSGLRFYGTVSAVPNTKVVDFQSDGDFEIGSGTNKITYVASTGTLAVPAATITSLTIAAIGSGVIGGSYASAGSNPKVTISTAGIVATNSGGTTTFNLESSSGDFFMTGNFTIASSTSAANRLELKQSGIELWKSSTREFYLQAGGAANTVTMLLTGGGVGQYIGMNPTDGLWLGASTFASGPFRVNTAGAVTMTSATITNGTLTSPSITSASITSTTITGQTIQTGSSNPKVSMTSSGVFVYNSGGTNTAAFNNDGSGFAGTGGNFSWNTSGTLTVNGSTLVANSVASGAIASLAVDKLTTGTITSQTITLGTGGKIVDADGSEWNSSGIILKSSGTIGDCITWKVSTTEIGYIWADSSTFLIAGGSGKSVQISGNGGGFASIQVVTSGGINAFLGDAGGTYQFKVLDSGSVQVFGVTSDGDFVRPIANDSTAEGTYYGRFPIYINGNLRYISVHNA